MLPIDISLAEALETLKTLIIFVVGILVYSLFIFKFYRFLARKDILKLNLDKYNTKTMGFLRKVISTFLYLIEYIFIVPVLIFFWFTVLTLLLSFLAKDQGIANILLVSMALIATVRITAYYSEDLSKDLAKMLPFALLGVFLINVSYFDINISIELLKQIPSFWKTLLYYLVFTIFLEFTLRIFHSIIQVFLSAKQKV